MGHVEQLPKKRSHGCIQFWAADSVPEFRESPGEFPGRITDRREIEKDAELRQELNALKGKAKTLFLSRRGQREPHAEHV